MMSTGPSKLLSYSDPNKEKSYPGQVDSVRLDGVPREEVNVEGVELSKVGTKSKVFSICYMPTRRDFKTI
jgi:hypothetical protein